MSRTKDVAQYVAANNGISVLFAESIMEDIFNVIADDLLSGTEVTLKGFGKFTVQERKARMGRNPKTGEPIEIPASRVIKFKPQKKLRDEVK